MNCFYCGKRKTNRKNFCKLDKNGHEICWACVRSGYIKSAIEIIEYNNKVDEMLKGVRDEKPSL